MAPQACFEIGLIYRRAGDRGEAKKWLKKTRNYSGYITETMINFRTNEALVALAADIKCNNNNEDEPLE